MGRLGDMSVQYVTWDFYKEIPAMINFLSSTILCLMAH